MAVDRTGNVSRAIDNYTRILVFLTEVIANPTQANVDAVVAAAGTDSLLAFRLDHSLDGESYNWVAYAEHVTKQIDILRKMEVALSGPYEVRSRAVSR